MKKIITFLLVLTMLFVFASCKKTPQENTSVEYVTDEAGETVTDENGNAVTRAVTAQDEQAGGDVQNDSSDASAAVSETTTEETERIIYETTTYPREENSDNPDIIDTWKTTIDIGSVPELEEFMPGNTIKTEIDTEVVFAKDGTFSIRYSKASVQKAEDGLFDSILDYLKNGGLAEILKNDEFSEEDAEMAELLDEMLQEEGGEELLSSMFKSEFSGLLTDSFAEYNLIDGYYTVDRAYVIKGDGIYFDGETEPSLSYSVSGDVLTLNVTDSAANSFEFFNMLTLTRK